MQLDDDRVISPDGVLHVLVDSAGRVASVQLDGTLLPFVVEEISCDRGDELDQLDAHRPGTTIAELTLSLPTALHVTSSLDDKIVGAL